MAHKNPDEHRSLGLFGLLRKESWGAKEPTKQKGKGRVTFALPRSDSKKKAALAKAAEEDRLMEELVHAHQQQLEEEWRTCLTKDGAGTDLVAADCVETVDMATHTEEGLGLTPAGDLGVGEEPIHPVLPPPDMFDDVHYMHSGPAYPPPPAHHSSNEDLVDDVPPSLQLSARSTPRNLSTFGTPRFKAVHSASRPASKGATSPSAEDPNPYLSMQPVIVDSRSSRKEESHSSGNVDLKTLGETVSLHFDCVQSFRPTKAQSAVHHKASVPSSEKHSPEKLHVNSSETEGAKDPLRPIPARRRLLDQSVSSGVASPRPAQSNGTTSQSDVTHVKTSEMSGSRASVVSPRVDAERGVHRVSPSRQSPNAGSALEVNTSSPASTPSPTHAPLSPVSVVQQEGAPRYNSPPSYAAAIGHRQSSQGKPSHSPPVYSASIPTAPTRSSPPASSTFQKYSSSSGMPVLRGNAADEGCPEGTKNTPKDVASPTTTASKNSTLYGLKETSGEQGNSVYSLFNTERELVTKNSPSGVSQTPREAGTSPVGAKPPTPRERSNSYGTRLAPRIHSSVHKTVITPRETSSPFAGLPETPRNSTQIQEWSRNSGSADTVSRVKDSVAALEQTRTASYSVQNGGVAHPSYGSVSTKGLHSHNAPRLLTSQGASHQASQSVEVLSPRLAGRGHGRGQAVNCTTVVVAADVHHHPPQHRTSPPDRRPLPRPLSAALESSAYAEQTVTFV